MRDHYYNSVLSRVTYLIIVIGTEGRHCLTFPSVQRTGNRRVDSVSPFITRLLGVSYNNCVVESKKDVDEGGILS